MKPNAETRIAQLTRNDEKWTSALMAEGWTAVPSVLLVYQLELGLDPLDLNILLQIAKHWWEAGNLPHPSKQQIAKAMNVAPRTVQRHLTNMEKVGLIERIDRFDQRGGRRTNGYRFAGLIAKAAEYAKEMHEERLERIAAKAKRQKRTPGLRVVK